ncbi:MAG: hypothetical protein JXA67_09360 [Micromonosporaceae bacterium]|nr:hypothetical protein [Micromonosporaceae bacterium]
MIAGLLGSCAVLGGLLVVRWRYTLVVVNGRSMAPTFGPGDRVLVRRVPWQQLRVGDVVVCHHTIPIAPATIPAWVIKRVAAIPGDPVPPLGIPEPERIVPPWGVVLLGDNPAGSADSREVGFFSLKQVRGKVIRRLG